MQSNFDNILQLRGVVKSFGEVAALKGIDLNVQKGILFGLIGPDGAGKTTLFRIITTLLLPDRGKIQVEGYDVVKQYRKIRNSVGYMPGRFSLYQDLTVEENLNFYATIFGASVKMNYHLIADIFIHLEPFRKRLVKNLSGGMKQKLALACAIIHNPDLLVLDEPTTGVDAVSRKEFWDNLRKLQQDGMSVLVSTPYMDEAEKCDQIALMHKGFIMEHDTPSNIIAGYSGNLYAIRSSSMQSLLHDLRAYEFCESAYLFGQTIHYRFTADNEDIKILRNYLYEKGHNNIKTEKIKPGIEDCFIHSANYAEDLN